MPGRCAGFLVLAWQVLCQEPKIGQPNFFGHVPLKPNLDLLNIMLKKFMYGQKVLHILLKTRILNAGYESVIVVKPS